MPLRHDRIPDDDYPTPLYCVRRLLEALPLPGGHWLEPSAGDGSIIRAVNELRADVQWAAVEKRLSCMARLAELPGTRHCIDDFLGWNSISARATWPQHFDVALGNPPYSWAQEFVERCLGLADHTVMLLRLDFMASAKRHGWLLRNPFDLYVLSNRPQFRFDGSDKTEYGWFHWPGTGHLRLLNLTPSGAR